MAGLKLEGLAAQSCPGQLPQVFCSTGRGSVEVVCGGGGGIFCEVGEVGVVVGLGVVIGGSLWVGGGG